MGRLDDKVAVITGAGGGMGREAAILFTEEGARVCVADVNREAAEETVSLCTGEAFAVEVDVGHEEQVASMYEQTASRFGGVDVLYNNAGISPGDDASVLETSVEAWQRVQDVNAKGVFLCCKHGIPLLLDRGGGSVINVASFVAIVGAATSQISYTASKGAVLAMSRELAVEFARRGVRVNALCPGPVETPLLLSIYGDDPAAFERRRIHWPTGRLARPREIVQAALFLASDDSSYVTGATFLVDGASRVLCDAGLGAVEVVFVRHGETEWSRSGRHTGRTEIPLTGHGREQAEAVGSALRNRRFAVVLTSPLGRALETCRLAGFGERAVQRDELMEWDYGAYEGRTTTEIREERPGWTLWDDGVPDGETGAQVGERVDRVIAEIRSVEGDALLFAHGHVLRVLAARWLGLEPDAGRLFALDPATLSTLGYERETPVIRLWNQAVADEAAQMGV